MRASRYQHVDAMRAVAVLIVVIAHAGLGKLVPGGSGVTLFFAISGFIITTLLLQERGRTGGFDILGFYTRRLVKLIPPLTVALVVPTLIAAVWIRIEWHALLGQVLFFFNWQALAHPEILPGSTVVWSLSIEEQFYIAVALLWLCIARTDCAVRYLAILSGAIVAASTGLRCMLADASSETVSDRIYYGSDTRADSLAWGILAALVLYRWQIGESPPSTAKRIAGSRWTLAISILVLLISLFVRDEWFRQTLRYSVQSIAASAVILYGFVAADSFTRRSFDGFCRIRIVQIIGLASYSIYLAHLCIIKAIQQLKMPTPIELFVGPLIGVGVGVLMYRLIEVPSRRAYERVRDRRRAPDHINTLPPKAEVNYFDLKNPAGVEE